MAILSLIALVVAILVGSTTKVNIGVFAIALSFVVGGFVAREDLGQIMSSFPSQLFLTLFAVTFLFSQAHANGTLGRITSRISGGLQHRIALLPIAFFLLSLGLASIGAGNIAATALVAPAAMSVAHKNGISSFLMAIMIANGANAGGLSPLAPTGVIASERMAQVGIHGLEWKTFLNSLLAHTLVAVGGYFLLGGLQLIRASKKSHRSSTETHLPTPFLLQHRVTLGVIGLVVMGAVFFKLDIAICALIASLVLSLLRAGNDTDAFARIPWNIILMVCGMSMLTSLLARMGGLNLFTDFVARYSNEHTVTAFIAFSAALVSVYSSSSAVVLPTFLLMIPRLVEKLPETNAAALAASITVAAHLVDVSPLSSIGALCIASASETEDRRALFNKMLGWGLAMSVVGAIVCYLLFGLLLTP